MFILTNDGKFSEKYSMGNLLGQGAFGEVRKCQNRQSKAIRAVKIIKKEQMTPEEEKSFKYEISILKQLDHVSRGLVNTTMNLMNSLLKNLHS